MDTEESTIVALLHDTLEDTDTTSDELLEMGFGPRIVDAIKLLTKPEELDYLEYVRLVKGNDLATKVKLADLTHNSDLSRLNNVGEKDNNRIEKYQQAIKILEEDD